MVTVSISRVVMLMFCDHSQSGCRRWDALDYTVKKPSRFHILSPTNETAHWQANLSDQIQFRLEPPLGPCFDLCQQPPRKFFCAS